MKAVTSILIIVLFHEKEKRSPVNVNKMETYLNDFKAKGPYHTRRWFRYNKHLNSLVI